MLNISWRHRKQKEDTTAGRLWRQAERGREKYGVEVWGGGESCQSVSIFTLRPRRLSHPVHPSTIPPSLTRRVSLLPWQPPPISLWRPPPTPTQSHSPPTPHSYLPPRTLNSQCSDYHGVANNTGSLSRDGTMYVRDWKRQKGQQGGRDGGRKGKGKDGESGGGMETEGEQIEWLKNTSDRNLSVDKDERRMKVELMEEGRKVKDQPDRKVNGERQRMGWKKGEKMGKKKNLAHIYCCCFCPSVCQCLALKMGTEIVC